MTFEHFRCRRYVQIKCACGFPSTMRRSASEAATKARKDGFEQVDGEWKCPRCLGKAHKRGPSKSVPPPGWQLRKART